MALESCDNTPQLYNMQVVHDENFPAPTYPTRVTDFLPLPSLPLQTGHEQASAVADGPARRAASRASTCIRRHCFCRPLLIKVQFVFIRILWPRYYRYFVDITWYNFLS